jgi:hypothetical protein
MNKRRYEFDVYKEMKRYNVTTVLYEDLLAMDNITAALNSEFQHAFVIQGAVNTGDSEDVDFDKITSERLLAVYAYMKVMLKSDVFHMENDNLLYFDLIDLMHRMHTCRVYLGLPKASSPQAVFSFFYVRNADILEHFLRYIIEILRLGRKKAMGYLKTEWISDMAIASRYFELFAGTSENSSSSGISQLPVKFDAKKCCLCISANNTETIIFDERTLGPYFRADYTNPNISFWAKSDFLDSQGELLAWQKTEKGLLVPYIRGKRIVNLQVLSKYLKRLSSS